VAAAGRIRELFVDTKVNASIAIHIITLSLEKGMKNSPLELVLVCAEASVTIRNVDDGGLIFSIWTT
jgi:hypothetical protein